MLKQHSQHCDEIVAILAHELGHWKLSHQLKGSVLDTAYMVIFGIILQTVENDQGFLQAFGFQ